jgi:RNA polymerase sigma-70 factor, ECF subfamily
MAVAIGADRDHAQFEPAPSAWTEYEPGSREDFDRLYRESYPRLLRTIYPVLGDRAAAEDCVQEAFVRAFKAWPRYRPERPVQAWLHQIAMNTAISYRRKQRLREVGEVLRRLGRPAPTRDPADAGNRSDLIAALAAQPPRAAAAFVLRHYHGYSNRELAVLLGVSERSVGEWLRRVREDLRRRLREELPTRGVSGVDILEDPDA